MAIALPSLISGLFAKLAAEQLFFYVLINVGMTIWSRKKQKKNAPEVAKSNSTQTNINIGDPITICFGTVLHGGNLFDVINPGDESWPVIGAIGYALPKSFDQGVELADRKSPNFPPMTVTGGTNQAFLAAHDDVNNLSAIYQSIRIGNDASKQIRNINWKWFPHGGFSDQAINQGVDALPPLVVRNLQDGGGGFDYIDVIPNNFRNWIANSRSGESVFEIKTIAQSKKIYILDTSTIYPLAIPIQIGDKLRFRNKIDGTLQWQTITHLFGYSSEAIRTGSKGVNNIKYASYLEPYDTWLNDETPTTDIMIGVDNTVKTLVDSHNTTWEVSIIRFDGVQAPDNLLTTSFEADRINTNKLAYLAVEVRNPGTSRKNVVNSVPSVSVFMQDLAMPNTEYLRTSILPGLSLTMDETVGDTWKNPFAIIYEILTDPVWGRGLDPVEFIDIPSIVELMNRCTAQYGFQDSGGTINDDTWKFGGYSLQSKTSALDVIQDILDHIHGGFVEKDGKIKFYMDGETPSVSTPVIDMSQLVRDNEDSNSVGEVGFKIQWIKTEDKPNSIDVKYVMPSAEYVYDTYFTMTDFSDLVFSKIKKSETLDLPGFWTEHHAKKSAQIHLNKSIYEKRVFECHVGATGLNFQEGDFIKLPAFAGQHDVSNAIQYSLVVTASQLADSTRYYFTGLYSPSGGDYEDISIGSKITATFNAQSVSRKVIDIGTDEDNKLYIDVDSQFDNTNTFFVQTLIVDNYVGLRSIKKDVYARVVQVRVHKDVSISVVAREYDIRTYDITDSRFVLQKPQIPNVNFVIDGFNKTPPKPVFRSMNIITQYDDAFIKNYHIVVSVGNLAYRSVDQTSITLYARNYVTDTDVVIGNQTLNHGDDVVFFQVNSVVSKTVDAGTDQYYNVYFYALAMSTSSTNVKSEVADSREDLKVDPNDPEFLTPAPQDALKPMSFELNSGESNNSGVYAFDAAQSSYGKKIVVVSKTFNYSSGVSLELRRYDNLVDHPSDWDDNQHDSLAQSHLVGRFQGQIVFEQDESLPNARTLYYYTRLVTPDGMYSASSSLLTLTNTVPITVTPASISVEVSGSNGVADITASESDLIKYELYLKDSEGVFNLIAESSSKTIPFSVPPGNFDSSGNYSGELKALAHDRIGPSAFHATGKAFTMSLSQSSQDVLAKIFDTSSDQLLRIGSWGQITYPPYLFTKQDELPANMYLMLDGTNHVTQMMTLEPGNYNISWQVVSGSPTLKVNEFDRSNVSPFITYTSPTQLATLTSSILSVSFTVTQPTPGQIRAVEFKIEGANGEQIKHMMLNRGQAQQIYSLNFNDRPIPGTTQQTFNYIEQQIIQSLDNFESLKDIVNQQGASIDKSDYEIALRVFKNGIASALILNEQGAYLGGNEIIIDGHTRFINSKSAVYGKVTLNINGDATAPTATVSSRERITDQTLFYQTDDVGTETQFTINSFTIDPDTGEYTFDIASGTPLAGFFSDTQNIDSTEIDGDIIKTGTIQADRIVASSIGAREIVADEIYGNRFSVIGDDFMIFDSKYGFFMIDMDGVTPETYVGVSYDINRVEFTEAVTDSHPALGDYVYIKDGNHKGEIHRVSSVALSSGINYYCNFTSPLPNDFDATPSFYFLRPSAYPYLKLGFQSGKPALFVGSGGDGSSFSTDGITLGTNSKITWNNVEVGGLNATPALIGAETPAGSQNKADTAQSNAESTASADATNKANIAQSNAESAAQSYTNQEKQKIINGTAQGTFINNKVITSPSIMAGRICGAEVFGATLCGGEIAVGVGDNFMKFDGTNGLHIGTEVPGNYDSEHAKFAVDLAGNVKVNSIKAQHLNKYLSMLTYSNGSGVYTTLNSVNVSGASGIVMIMSAGSGLSMSGGSLQYAQPGTMYTTPSAITSSLSDVKVVEVMVKFGIFLKSNGDTIANFDFKYRFYISRDDGFTIYEYISQLFTRSPDVGHMVKETIQLPPSCHPPPGEAFEVWGMRFQIWPHKQSDPNAIVEVNFEIDVQPLIVLEQVMTSSGGYTS